MALFLIAVAATVYWMGLYARDAWIGLEPLIAGRFDSTASLTITSACLASVAGPSVLLNFAPYKKTDYYGSPLELFFGVVFGLSSTLALMGLLVPLGAKTADTGQLLLAILRIC